MTVRKRLLDEINAKANRIKDMRAKSKDTSIERDVFEFFKNADEARLIAGGNTYQADVLSSAFEALIIKLRRNDPFVGVKIEWADGLPEGESQIRGITIKWSHAYSSKMNISDVEYIDVGQMIFA